MTEPEATQLDRIESLVVTLAEQMAVLYDQITGLPQAVDDLPQ